MSVKIRIPAHGFVMAVLDGTDSPVCTVYPVDSACDFTLVYPTRVVLADGRVSPTMTIDQVLEQLSSVFEDHVIARSLLALARGQSFTLEGRQADMPSIGCVRTMFVEGTAEVELLNLGRYAPAS